MKVSEAEKLICPFIEADKMYGIEKYTVHDKKYTCLATKCMAWKETKTEEVKVQEWTTRWGEYSKDKDVEVISLGEGRYKNISRTKIKDLEPQDCEGYCQRIGQ